MCHCTNRVAGLWHRGWPEYHPAGKPGWFVEIVWGRTDHRHLSGTSQKISSHVSYGGLVGGDE